MLRCVLASIAVSIATIVAAQAAPQLPISATYGSASACDLYSKGGGNAVYSAGASIGRNTPIDADMPEYMIVSPDEIVGFEWVCIPEFVEGASVMLLCESAGEKPEPITVMLNENATTDELTYSDQVGTVVLPQCD